MMRLICSFTLAGALMYAVMEFDRVMETHIFAN
jgi:hypothetical protein